MEGLPLLPGYTFGDPTKTRYHRSQCFDFRGGYAFPKTTCFGIGKEPLDVDSVAFLKDDDTIKCDPVLTYGILKRPVFPSFHPHFEIYDKKALNFKAYFKQSVFESPVEHYRVRHVNIVYFLENDTITVMEPPTENSGFSQGRLVRRGKIPKKDTGRFWHWKDFNIGMDVPMYGFIFHIVDCDAFTKKYLTSQGIELRPPEDMPPDPYTITRKMSTQPKTRVTHFVDDKLRRFLEYDRRILRLYAVLEENDAECEELKPFIIYYFLVDDCVEIKEVHGKNDGRDPVPLLLKKTKLPKNWNDLPATFPSSYLETSEAEVTEYYTPVDFVIGNTISIFGRRFLIYDCDKFTRDYFENVLRVPLRDPINVFKKQTVKPMRVYPPHLGFGTPQDSLQSCLSLMPKPPKKDILRYIQNANKVLRYTAEMEWSHPEDEGRKFQISYSLSDCKITIYEPPVRNSGIIGGTFLRATLVPKDGASPDFPEYYTPADFYIGAVVTIFNHRFKITGADLFVYHYMQQNQDKFSPDIIDNMRNYMVRQGFLKEEIQELMKKYQEEEEQHQEEEQRHQEEQERNPTITESGQ
ncbi:EF-hand domain-containing protein 1-like isoform X2 [Schistocerca gregaria]|uniref:EF-hand domain-containing protein 1-like isoform X2 n=1 Tax=Schistocerca gregaria TaxID=7010 RepID=UPI00211F16DF|nr:EF-hand domain-containing protein 1-like isoform X2 [Schistocerca gregaria]